MPINLTEKQKIALINNWGDRAESLACNAIVRLYDPLSRWECYLYAMNPQDENDVLVILKKGLGVCVLNETWTMSELDALFNEHGEGIGVDESYRPRSAESILKRT